MKLKKPEEVKKMLAKRHNWLTHKEIAQGVQIAENTVNRAMRGDAVRAQTVRALATALEVEPISIAEFVN
jgi:DNA-binding Xre family transcriptional regulator